MTWRKETSGGCEAAKIAPIVVPYVQGKCLDLGSGQRSVWPRVVGMDRAMEGGIPVTSIVGDIADLSRFADLSHDGIFSSFALQEFPPSGLAKVLKEWARIIKFGGYLTLYLPCALYYPKVGSEEASPANESDFYPGDIERLLEDQIAARTHGWKLIVSEARDQGDEYALLIVAQKTAEPIMSADLWQRNPEGKKRALVIRYGAIGDAFVAASVLPLLKREGYHVTFNTTPRIQDILQHDPHVDEWFIQETDFVPNAFLGPFWAVLSQRYDRVINLSESVEGIFLTLPGRLNHAYSHGARDRVYGKHNYLEHTHDIADVPYEFDGRFYPTTAEIAWAEAVARRRKGPIIVWCVNGSSPHKVYPWTHIVMAWLLQRTDAHLFLYGDPVIGHELATGIMGILEREGYDMSRVFSVCDKWNLRQSLTFCTRCADIIVGPETGPLNAAAMEDIPKVIYLSHSSADNLTKHWRNTTTLVPAQGRAPCFPCHRLHTNWDYCHIDQQANAALCASAIAPEHVMDAILGHIAKLKAA